MSRRVLGHIRRQRVAFVALFALQRQRARGEQVHRVERQDPGGGPVRLGAIGNAEVQLRHVRRLILGGAVGLALVSCLLSAAPAMGDEQARSLELNALKDQFTSFACLNVSCSLVRVTAVGKATSNLSTGAGSDEATLIFDFSPGGSCNIVDESRTFSFAEGTISVHSHHEDCATHGLRVDTTFDVTGGTGVVQGASGSGRELSTPAQPGLEYIGTISF